MKIITVKCPKCGLKIPVVSDRIKAVYCPKDKTRIPLRPEKPEEEAVKEAKIEEVKPKKKRVSRKKFRVKKKE